MKAQILIFIATAVALYFQLTADNPAHKAIAFLGVATLFVLFMTIERK